MTRLFMWWLNLTLWVTLLFWFGFHAKNYWLGVAVGANLGLAISGLILTYAFLPPRRTNGL